MTMTLIYQYYQDETEGESSEDEPFDGLDVCIV